MVFADLGKQTALVFPVIYSKKNVYAFLLRFSCYYFVTFFQSFECLFSENGIVSLFLFYFYLLL